MGLRLEWDLAGYKGVIGISLHRQQGSCNYITHPATQVTRVPMIASVWEHKSLPYLSSINREVRYRSKAGESVDRERRGLLSSAGTRIAGSSGQSRLQRPPQTWFLAYELVEELKWLGGLLKS